MERLTVQSSQLDKRLHSDSRINTDSTSLHDGLYARLIDIFKEGFVTVNGDSPDRYWCDLFDRMKPKQLKRGVANARDAKKEAVRQGKRFYPPDVDTFEAYCTTPRPDDPACLSNPYEISEAIKGTCRHYGIDFEGKKEEQLVNDIWEAKNV